MFRDLRSAAPILVSAALVPQLLSIAAFICWPRALSSWAYLLVCVVAGIAWSFALFRRFAGASGEQRRKYWWLLLLLPVSFGFVPLTALLTMVESQVG